MIDSGVLNALLLGLGGILGAIAVWIQQRAKANTHEVEARGDVAKAEAATDLRLTDAILKLAEGINETNKQSGLERQQTLMAIERSGGRTEGMMVAIVDHTKAVREMELAIDEFGGRLQHLPQIKSDVVEIKASTAALSSLETNLGESFGEQFIPVVKALQAVEKAVRDLAKELEERDDLTSKGLQKLTGLFYEAKLEFMRRISPDVEQHIDELLPKDTPNGNPPNEHTQELPVNIHITSAAPPKETP